eukprot:15482171-Alexandrium_andersonii.AAC.1
MLLSVFVCQGALAVTCRGHLPSCKAIAYKGCPGVASCAFCASARGRHYDLTQGGIRLGRRWDTCKDASCQKAHTARRTACAGAQVPGGINVQREGTDLQEEFERRSKT